MQVILLEHIEKLGALGDEVTVRTGHARNFLLPQGKALRATKANREYFEAQRADLENLNQELRGQAETGAAKLTGKTLTMIRQSSESGHLYGSVTSRDIAGQLSENGFSITRTQVILAEPIKVLGLHEVLVRLHPEITSTITINVARTKDEAKRQLRGEDVTIELTDEQQDAALLAEQVFEEQVLAKQAEEAEVEAEAEVGAEAEKSEQTPEKTANTTDTTDTTEPKAADSEPETKPED